jgi:DNA polymerase I-like protein with 3'-5' exonuclease and polymerase domains
MRLHELEVGHDGRNRCLVSAFRARTGRNQPSNSRFVFGPAVWLRGLIQPPPGHAVVYLDWQQQEFGIAAALSDDPLMQAAYRSGDPYLAFAKQAGAAPTDATKASHGPVRDRFKQCVLAVQYGQGAEGLAARIGQPPIAARALLSLHRETYRTFWRWSDQVVDYALLTGGLHTTFGWRLRAGADPNVRSLQNFPMQSNGAEMLRIAACLATEAGVEVCALIHDAVLICSRFDRLDEAIARTQDAMREASRIVLAGFELGVDSTTVRHPDRYSDPRGKVMWERVMRLLVEAETAQKAA